MSSIEVSNSSYFTALCGNGRSFTETMTRGFAAFHRRASEYGAFITGLGADDTHSSQINLALKLYRRSLPERRRAVDDFMTAHPDANAYRAAMQSLLNESNGTSPHAFERLVLLYDAISSLAGPRGDENAVSLLSSVPDTALELEGRELESYRAMTAVTAMCIFDEFGMMSGYLAKITGVNSVKPPALHVWNGVMMALRPEYAKVVEAYPERMILIANAMRASHTKLSVGEMEAAALGIKPEKMFAEAVAV